MKINLRDTDRDEVFKKLVMSFSKEQLLNLLSNKERIIRLIHIDYEKQWELYRIKMSKKLYAEALLENKKVDKLSNAISKYKIEIGNIKFAFVNYIQIKNTILNEIEKDNKTEKDKQNA